jgi:hypothetical protein
MIKEVKQFIWEGRPMVNQIVVSTDSHDYLVSYGKIVAKKGVDGAFLAQDWNITRTTAKYVARFFDYSVKDIKRLVKEGVYNIVSKIFIE